MGSQNQNWGCVTVHRGQAGMGRVRRSLPSDVENHGVGTVVQGTALICADVKKQTKEKQPRASRIKRSPKVELQLKISFKKWNWGKLSIRALYF